MCTFFFTDSLLQQQQRRRTSMNSATSLEGQERAFTRAVLTELREIYTIQRQRLDTLISSIDTNMPSVVDEFDTIGQAKRRCIDRCLPALNQLYSDTMSANPTISDNTFTQRLVSSMRYNALSRVTALKLPIVPGTRPTVVSSAEFNDAGNMFATGGVDQILRIFRYADDQSLSSQPPSLVMMVGTAAKISGTSWSHNPATPMAVAISDYAGTVRVWDASTKTLIATFDEHVKSTWSVDFSISEPRLLASGSDDFSAKIWSCEQPRSVSTIGCDASVCTVKFNPCDANQIALGGADHHVHLYDLRNTTESLHVYKGHAKSISYVRFVSPDELVTASTDSTLKLWNINEPRIVRTYTGHVSTRHFTGMAVADDVIVCGSEDNTVYVYHKHLAMPIATYAFEPTVGKRDEFVSAVALKRSANEYSVLVGNSAGKIEILKLSSDE